MLKWSRGQTELSHIATLDWRGEKNPLARKQESTGTLTKRGIWEHILKTNPIVFIGYQSMVATLQSAEWHVKRGNAQKKHEKYVKDAFFRYLLTSMAELVGNMLLAPGMGAAPHEPSFIQIGGFWYPRTLEYRPIRTFELSKTWRDRDGWYYAEQRFYSGRDGRYTTVDYGRANNQPWLWWIKYGDTIYGTPILRSIITEHATKEDVRKIIAIAVQKQLLPPPAVYLRDGVKQPREGEADYAEYNEMLDEVGATIYHEEGVVGVPGYVDRIEPLSLNPESLTGAIQTMNHLDIQILLAFGAHWMARGILAQFGSNAAAKVDVSEQRNIRQHYLNWMSTQFDWLIKLLIDINFGPQISYPRLVATYRPVLETAERAKIARELKQAGMLSWTDADEEFQREELSLPAREVESPDQPRKDSKALPAVTGAVGPDGDNRGDRPSEAEDEEATWRGTPGEIARKHLARKNGGIDDQ